MIEDRVCQELYNYWRSLGRETSKALVTADHFNGWFKWFYWLCPSMAPIIPCKKPKLYIIGKEPHYTMNLGSDSQVKCKLIQWEIIL